MRKATASKQRKKAATKKQPTKKAKAPKPSTKRTEAPKTEKRQPPKPKQSAPPPPAGSVITVQQCCPHCGGKKLLAIGGRRVRHISHAYQNPRYGLVKHTEVRTVRCGDCGRLSIQRKLYTAGKTTGKTPKNPTDSVEKDKPDPGEDSPES